MPGKSLGGVPSNAVPAHLASQRGDASSTLPTDRTLVQGGEWVGEAPKCIGVLKDKGWPCDQPPRKGKSTCFGHRHDEV